MSKRLSALAGASLLILACAERSSNAPPPGPVAAPTAPAPTAAAAPAPTPVAPASAAGPCEGPHISLTAAIANASCRISEDEADRLRDVLEDATKAPLKVDAVALADGRVKVRITNTGGAPQSLPLLVHSHLDNFDVSVKAQRLSPPEPDWPAGFRFETGRMLTKIVLPPGGVAEATLRIQTKIVSQEYRNCPPNAKCAPTTVEKGQLPPGKHQLSIRTPLYSIRADLAATLGWTH